MMDADDRFAKTSRLTTVLTFILHQLIATYGITATAPFLMTLSFRIFRLFAHRYPDRTFNSILTEIPSFPVQIIFALLLGWLLGRALQRRVMLWVWVIPFAILCAAFFAVSIPATEMPSIISQPFPGQIRLAHFFGYGCRPANRCIDQLLLTLPFYSSLAYAFGALLARKVFTRPNGRSLSVTILCAGSLMLFAVAADLISSASEPGWKWMFLAVGVIPSILGVYVIYVAVSVWRRPLQRELT
ncbi:MAG TPA: hypothetical protein VGD60_01005 [Candidatus Acidoferrales bacterium]